MFARKVQICVAGNYRKTRLCSKALSISRTYVCKRITFFQIVVVIKRSKFGYFMFH